MSSLFANTVEHLVEQMKIPERLPTRSNSHVIQWSSSFLDQNSHAKIELQWSVHDDVKFFPSKYFIAQKLKCLRIDRRIGYIIDIQQLFCTT